MIQKISGRRFLNNDDDDPDYRKIREYLSDYFQSGREIKSDLGLTESEIRIYRSIIGIMDAIKFARESIDNKNDVFQNALKEGESLIFSLMSGKVHPAIKFFESMRSGGRPRYDPLSMQTLIHGAACLQILMEHFKKRKAAIRLVVQTVKHYPNAFDAQSLENFINRSEERRNDSPEDERAIKHAENLLRKLIKDASDRGVEMAALEALEVALENTLGPSKQKKSKPPIY